MKRITFLTLTALLLAAPAGMAQAPEPQAIDALNIKPVTQRPCLLMDPSDISEVKHRLEAMLDHPPANLKKMDGVLYGLLYGDEVFKKKVSADFMADARKRFTVKPGTEYQGYRRYNEMLYHYDVIASFGYLSDAERMEFRDLMVNGAVHYTGDEPSRFPSRQTPLRNGTEFPEGFSTCNRWTDQVMVGALVGLNFPELPLAKAWVRYAAGQIQYQLDNGVWDGAWNEVPRYHNWTMLLYSGFFQALQRRAGIDFYQHRNTKALLDWYVRFSSSLVRLPGTTARNPAGEPTLPVWGDSNYGPHFTVPAMFAPHYVASDPAFSKRLMWMWRRAGSPFQHGWQFDLIFPILADPSLPDAPQILGSDFCKKFGYVLLRSAFNTPYETVVYMRGGQRGILHPRSDLGSIDLFSQGIPLALGSESGPYGEGIEWNRSQISNNDVVFGGKSRDRRECSGKIDAFYTGPQADYAVADCSRPTSKYVKQPESFHWRRHLLLVKRPDYLVVWDEISSPMASEWFLHTTAEKFDWQKGLVTCHTAYNADLDVHVLSPAGALVPNEKEGRFGQIHGKADPYPFTTLKYFSIPARPDEHFITVLHPRKPDDVSFKAGLVSASKDTIRLQITLDGRTDLVTLGADGASYQRANSSAMIVPMRIDDPQKQ